MNSLVFSIHNKYRLALVAVLGTLVVFGAADRNHCATRGSHQCTLTPQQIEGPYFIPNTAFRSNIREDRLGLPFGVDFVIQDTNTCAPIEGLIVHLWAADAIGEYSGFINYTRATNNNRTTPTDETRFLRGYQITDNNGSVHFDLIIPGWYEGRCAHMHIETFLPIAIGGINQTIHTTQAYFPDELYTSFRNKSVYIDNQNVFKHNEEDNMYLSQQGESLIMDIQPVSENPDTDGYVAKMVLGIDISTSGANSLNANLAELLLILVRPALMLIRKFV